MPELSQRGSVPNLMEVLVRTYEIDLHFVTRQAVGCIEVLDVDQACYDLAGKKHRWYIAILKRIQTL